MEEKEAEILDFKSEVTSLARKAKDNYINGISRLSKYVTFSQYENIETIDAYINSKHISGAVDDEGREKPFFNIVIAAVNLWYRATDIDRKDIRIKATKLKYWLMAFIATIHLQDWMKTSRFGAFLNEWGRSLAKYGSSPLKFVEVDGELYSIVVPWNRLISDPINFENNPKIEIMYLTASQLKANPQYNQKAVADLIERSDTVRKTIAGDTKDLTDDYYEIWEVHGMFPMSWVTLNPEDKDKYTQQMHVVSSLQIKQSEYEDFCLYYGGEKEDPYMLTHLIKEDGRAQSIGAVEYLFDAQWMQNHTVKAIKDQLDLASLQVFQTADGNFLGINVLSAMQNGDILVHTPNNPLTQVNNASHDIGSLKTFGEMFFQNGQRTVSATDAITGNNMPANTPFSSLELMNTESHGLFEIMTENKGFHIEDMMRRFILPHIRSKMDTAKEIAATLADNDIQKFDSIYVPSETVRRANNKSAEKMFNGEVAPNPDFAAIENEIKGELSQLGNQRFIKPSDLDEKTWNDFFDDFVMTAEVEVTNEQRDKQTVMQTLSTALKAIASDPTLLQDPTKRYIFSKLLETTGVISTIELGNIPTDKPNPQASGGSPKIGGEIINQIQ